MARPNLTTHRKFRRLARVLGSPLIARGALELLWESAYESGDDYVGTAEDLEALVGWTGEHGALARALADAGAPEGYGFIEAIDAEAPITRYKIHDLWHHAPDYVAKRRKRELERLERVAPSAKRRRPALNGKNRHVVRDSQPGDTRTPSPSPAPSPARAPARAPAPEKSDDTPRVQRFIDRYRELHGEYCGVAYLGNPVTDYREACALVQAFEDDLLEKLTVYWLNDRDSFALDGTRTIAKFRSRASRYAEELKAQKLA